MTTYNYNADRVNNNKEDMPFIIALLMICIITLLLCFAHKFYTDTHYSAVAFVDSITDEEVLLVDPCGDVWAVDAIKGAKVGDLVNVYFYNNGTTYTHTDDIITYVRIL